MTAKEARDDWLWGLSGLTNGKPGFQTGLLLDGLCISVSVSSVKNVIDKVYQCSQLPG